MLNPQLLSQDTTPEKPLFDILEELEKRVDVKKYDTFHARFYGRISELLLDVYLRTNNIKYKEDS